MFHEPIESDLIRHAVAGDRASLSQLLLLHYEELKRHIAQQLSNDRQGLLLDDDVLQETFVRAARAIADFEPRRNGSLCAWLKTIAGNLIKDAHKRRRRERRSPCSPGRDGSPDSSAVPFIDRLAGDTTSPSRRARRSESLVHLRAALDGLSPEQREVVQRYYLQDQSFDQIAAALDRTRDAVRGICYRARRQLHEMLGQSSRYFSG